MKEVTKVNNEKCVHDGHRKRLLDTVNAVGLIGLSDIQALEFILFFIIPRGDVNPLAHRLLDRFKNVSTVLDASVEDLMEVKGVGETAAKKIHSLVEVFNYYTNKKLSEQPPSSLGDFLDYVEQLLRCRNEEEVYLFGVNIAGEVMQGRCFGKGGTAMVSLNMRDIALYVSTYKMPGAYIVHNHPGGSCMASKQDNLSYEQMLGLFSFSGCKLIDSLIIGIDGIYSMARQSKIRIFTRGVEYDQALFLEDMLED